MMKIFLYSLVVGLSVACSMNFTKETNSLVQLLDSYGDSIPETECVFILHSRVSCHGCVQRMFVQINANVNATNSIPITIISSSSKDVPLPLSEVATFVEDVDNEIEEQFIRSVNLTLIRTINGQVSQFKIIETTDSNIYPNEIDAFFAKK